MCTVNKNLVFSQSALPLTTSGPLRDGPDVSWIPRIATGDDQGRHGACALFAMANWSEAVFDRLIGSEEALRAYARARELYNIPDGGGMSFVQAFVVAQEFGWMPGRDHMQPVDDLTRIADQPILCGYKITAAWDNINAAGCLDHSAPNEPVTAYHATVAVAHGSVPGVSDAQVTGQNSWGLSWGFQGLFVMTEELHRRLCQEMWTIV